MFLHCVPQLACKLVNFLIEQLLTTVDACFSSSEGLANLHLVSDKATLKIYRITTVVIKINVISNLSDSELSIDMAL